MTPDDSEGHSPPHEGASDAVAIFPGFFLDETCELWVQRSQLLPGQRVTFLLSLSCGCGQAGYGWQQPEAKQ